MGFVYAGVKRQIKNATFNYNILQRKPSKIRAISDSWLLGSRPGPSSSTFTRAYDTVSQWVVPLAPNLPVHAYRIGNAKWVRRRFVGWGAITFRNWSEWTAARTRANGIVSIKAAIPVKSSTVLRSACLVCENCRAYQIVVCLECTLR